MDGSVTPVVWWKEEAFRKNKMAREEGFQMFSPSMHSKRTGLTTTLTLLAVCINTHLYVFLHIHEYRHIYVHVYVHIRICIYVKQYIPLLLLPL